MTPSNGSILACSTQVLRCHVASMLTPRKHTCALTTPSGASQTRVSPCTTAPLRSNTPRCRYRISPTLCCCSLPAVPAGRGWCWASLTLSRWGRGASLFGAPKLLMRWIGTACGDTHTCTQMPNKLLKRWIGTACMCVTLMTTQVDWANLTRGQHT